MGPWSLLNGWTWPEEIFLTRPPGFPSNKDLNEGDLFPGFGVSCAPCPSLSF